MKQIINAEGWECPKPIIETKRLLDTMTEGSVITIVDNDIALINLTNFAESLGYKVSHTQEKNLYKVTIEKDKDLGAIVRENSLVIVITTDIFGQGAKELGESLMKGYIYALTEVSPRPKTLIFINSGVFFTVENSVVEESLRALEAEGVEILTCGACLNFYGLADKLVVGKVSNMYTIVEKLNNASNSIKI
jgi:selenium metabolism protein YedF